MKLPQDKKERTKLLVVIALAAVLGILGITQGIIGPVRRYKKGLEARLEETQAQVDTANQQIRRVNRSFDEERERVETILEISRKHVLKPVLGNYLLSASEIVEKQATEIGLQTEPLREVGISEVPRGRKGRDDPTLKCYAVRVTLKCDYNELRTLLKALESENPYLTVTGLNIIGQPNVDIEHHAVTFDLQWPIWADPDKPSALKEQLTTRFSVRGQNGA